MNDGHLLHGAGIDRTRFARYVADMNAIEFITELGGTSSIEIPASAAAQLPKAGKARVIILTDDGTDEAEWRSASYQQFLRDDSEEDAIYDSLR